MRMLLLGVLIGFFIGIALRPAGAQGAACGPVGPLLERLSGRYGEAAVAGGMAVRNGRPVLLQFWLNGETGTWTVIVLDEDGRGCIMAAGVSGRASPPPDAGEDS